MEEGRDDEATDILNTLFEALRTIAVSGSQDRQLIANSRHEAERFAVTIAMEAGSARPRILACLRQYEACTANGQVGATGWLLFAIEQRIAECDLPDWRKLRAVANIVVRALPRPKNVALH